MHYFFSKKTWQFADNTVNECIASYDRLGAEGHGLKNDKCNMKVLINHMNTIGQQAWKAEKALVIGNLIRNIHSKPGNEISFLDKNNLSDNRLRCPRRPNIKIESANGIKLIMIKNKNYMEHEVFNSSHSLWNTWNIYGEPDINYIDKNTEKNQSSDLLVLVPRQETTAAGVEIH